MKERKTTSSSKSGIDSESDIVVKEEGREVREKKDTRKYIDDESSVSEIELERNTEPDKGEKLWLKRHGTGET